MSALFGIFRTDGKPVSAEELQRMQASLANWGPDETACWRQGGVGLGYVQLHSLPEDLNPPHPIWHAESQQAVIAIARLDNRDELSDALGLSLAERVTYSDSALVQAAYRRWGESCPSRLLGDWALAAWDARSQRLFLARDQLGSHGLFFYHRPPFFAFASGLEALLALPDYPRRIDEVYLYRFLVGAPDEADRLAWEGIKSIRPGQNAIVTTNGLTMAYYWSAENIPMLPNRTEAEYLEGFLVHLRTAVRGRLRSLNPVSITLSGGLDSAAIAALAAEALAEKNQRLTALTVVPAFAADHLAPHRMSNEWALAHTLTRRWENIDHVELPLKESSPWAAMEEFLRLCPHPVGWAADVYFMLGLLREASRRKTGVQLTGGRGNATISWSGGSAHILHLAMCGRWSSAFRELASWRQRHGCSWLAAWRRKVLSPARRQICASFSHSHATFPENQRFFQPTFDKLMAGEKSPMPANSFLKRIAPRDQRLSMLPNPRASGVSVLPGVASHFGILQCHPAGDLRLAEYCLGMPSWLDTLGGTERNVIRTAMRTLVPDEILDNQTRGVQSVDLPMRLMEYADDGAVILARLGAGQTVPQMINMEAIKAKWHSLCAHECSPSARHAHLIFSRAVMVGLFMETAVRR